MLKRSEIKVLVLTGDGINCEQETALAFKELGVDAQIIHIEDLIIKKELLKSAHILALPGGFSFGDEIGSGQILALKLKYSLGNEINEFIESKKLIIGICNGFQALVRMGLLPKPFENRVLTLTHNDQGHFINRWVDLEVPDSVCAWTTDLKGEKLILPIRHGEGRIVFKGNQVEQENCYHNLCEQRQVAMTYADNVNGSYQNIAGLCDPSGLIFGLMQHPEAAISMWQYPSGKDKSYEKGLGILIFESGLKYCENNL
ncbi:MAG: phosphoribosylformylglycinamidine synthase subunit PurQ [Bacteriovoracaceae bacterium]|nr:phosphoribosylformylglycinamidine synthase subunit PurQ [Bacteriovoracaceae bacterium]